ncbi:hypothetical protein [Bacillus seohaeanensis]|jgi:hypothetical protein|uniref:Uncharacterized protein n=1 Tax=Bacillus seohaeanensis TaxID=284580 RepID=A0ABW5RRF3_9BACI
MNTSNQLNPFLSNGNDATDLSPTQIGVTAVGSQFASAEEILSGNAIAFSLINLFNYYNTLVVTAKDSDIIATNFTGY